MYRGKTLLWRTAGPASARETFSCHTALVPPTLRYVNQRAVTGKASVQYNIHRHTNAKKDYATVLHKTRENKYKSGLSLENSIVLQQMDILKGGSIFSSMPNTQHPCLSQPAAWRHTPTTEIQPAYSTQNIVHRPQTEPGRNRLGEAENGSYFQIKRGYINSVKTSVHKGS